MFKYSNKFLFWSPSNIRCNSQQNITFKWTLTFQRNCIEFALNAKPVRRYIPKNPLQYKLWAFATSPICEYTVFVAIMLNTLSLALKFYDQPKVYTEVLDALNIMFTVFFTLEFILKLGAFKFKVIVDQLNFILVRVKAIGNANNWSYNLILELFWWSMECLWFYNCTRLHHWHWNGQAQCKYWKLY